MYDNLYPDILCDNLNTAAMLTQEKRPRLKIELTPFDKLLEAIGWCVLLVVWIGVIISYGKLPKIIPTHYNSHGVVDGYGNRSFIWMLPIVASVLFVGVTFANRVPHIFNYLTTITEENALRQYTIATKMMRFLKLVLVLVIGCLVFKTITIAEGTVNDLGGYFTPLMLGAIFSPIVYYLFASIKNQ